MIELSTAIWASIGIFVYYMWFFVFSDWMKAGMAINSPNRLISELRTEYKVNIRTFQRNDRLRGFEWFKSIWLNENLFKNKKALLRTFHHEYYHLTHRHKTKLMLMYLMIILSPLLLIIINWYYYAPLMLSVGLIVSIVQVKFEKGANDHASKMTGSESKSGAKILGGNR